MMKKKLAISVVIAVSAALSLGVGCKKDDETTSGDGDSVTPEACEALCATSTECGDMADCLTECESVSESCPDEVSDYLDCADGKDDIMCLDVTALGISASCIAEATAIQLCALPPGDGDGDNTGGTTGDGDGDGDTGGSPGTGGTTPQGGQGGQGGEGGAGGATN